MKIATLALSFSCFLSHYVLSQQVVSTKEKRSTSISVQDSKIDSPSDEFHKMLARSNGKWTGQATMTFSTDSPPITSTSTLTNTMAMGGLYQVSEIKYNMMGKQTTGIRVTGYDAAKRIFTRAMIQDGGNGVAMEGPWDEATKSMSFRYKQANSSTGRENEMKEVYTIVDEDTEILELFRLDPATKKESKILNVKWTRDK